MMEEQEHEGGIGTRWRNRNKMEEQEHVGGIGTRWRRRKKMEIGKLSDEK